MKKKLLTVLVCIAVGFFSQPAFAEDGQIELIINNRLYQAQELSSPPVIVQDRAYVPLRLIGESLGYKVNWLHDSRQVWIDSEESFDDSELPSAVDENAPVTLKILGNYINRDEGLGTAFINENNITMVPVRLVMESLNCDVIWMDGLVIVKEKEPVVEIQKPITPVVEVESTEEAQEESVEHHWYDTLTIQGKNILTADELNAYLKAKEPEVRRRMEKSYPEKGFTPYPENIAELYIQIGQKYNIRGDLAFAQAVKETGYFQFTGDVQPWQNNYCGLWATGQPLTGEEPLNGVDPAKAVFIPETHGVTYAEVAYGVEAHIQHLYAYCSKNTLPIDCEKLDPRFSYVSRGVAPYWIDLGGRWAVPGVGYGNSIIEDYWMPANKSNKLVGELSPKE